MKWFYAWKFRRAMADLEKWRALVAMDPSRPLGRAMGDVETALLDECWRLAKKAGMA